MLPDGFARNLLNSIVQERGGEGAPTAEDSVALRGSLQARIDMMFGGGDDDETRRRGPDQCHDITLYPEIGRAGGACEGYGLLLDISDPVNPVRIDAVADSNFAYWHSATFSNDGSSVIFTDEWGGGGGPKLLVDDPYEWEQMQSLLLKMAKWCSKITTKCQHRKQCMKTVWRTMVL